MLVYVAALLLAGCGEPIPVPEPGSAREAALEHVGEHDARDVTTEVEENDSEATVTVTLHGLRDDSVRDERHVIELVWDDAQWRVERDDVSFRCQEGRGHRDFSREPCL